MLLQGKVSSQRYSHVSMFRSSNESLYVLCSGDHGVTEYEVAPGEEAMRKCREIAPTCSGPVRLAVRDKENILFVGSSVRADSNPRRVTVWSGGQNVVATRQFPSPVLDIECSRKGRVAVVLGDCIFWYTYGDEDAAVRKVPTCPNNKHAVCALSEDGKLLAYPVSANVIGIRHLDEEIAQITTDAPFSHLRFNPEGGNTDLLAAAAEDGTTVWVWAVSRIQHFDQTSSSVTPFALNFVFIRSRTQRCRVQALDFNAASTLLALASDSGTVHVFELSESNRGSATGGLAGAVLPRWATFSEASSKWKLRVGDRKHSLVALLVGDEFMEDIVGEGTTQRSVFVPSADGSLLEFVLSDGQDATTLDVKTPVRRHKLF